jgi:nucleoside-diphosphate-sugar epimerase
MKVLLTGHDGYIGAVMTRVFQDAGHTVSGLDTGFFTEAALGGELEPIETIPVDLRDIKASDLAGIDAIAHLAALSNDPLGDINPDLTFDINYEASVSLAKAAREAGVKRFVYSSSCSMYGASDEVLDENAEFNPLTPYAESKIRAEIDIRELATDTFSPTYMRNATAYGASPRFRADIVLNNLTCWAFTTGEVKILSDGMAWRPIVHIEDISRAFLAVLEAPRETVHNEAFNIGFTDENYLVRDIAEIVKEVVVDCNVTYGSERTVDPRSYRVDFTKFETAFPDLKGTKWTAREGVKELYETFKRANLTLEDFQGRKYVRLNQLKHLMDSGELKTDLRWVQ